jgi:hypothetical protein
MAGKYGSADVTLTYDSSPGGGGVAVQNFILNGVSAKVISHMMETTGLGDADVEQTPVGLKSYEVSTLEGLWDDTPATGSHFVFGTIDDGPNDATRTMAIVFGDSKTFTVETRLMSYEVFAENGQIQRFRAEILPTGAGVWS